MLTKKIKFHLPFRIALIYFLISGLYIVFSDIILNNTISAETLTKFQSYKGLAFVFITSFLIYILIKKNLKKIKDSEQKYRLLANHSKDLIFSYNTKAEVVYLSPSVEKLLGYNLNDTIGKKPSDFIHPDDLKKADKNFNNLLLDEKTEKPIIYRIKKKENDEYIWFESVRQLIKDKGEIIGVVSSNRDITERIASDKALKNHRKSLRNLTSEILLVEETQRKEIAANIHDHLSQSLVIAKMKLQDLRAQNSLDAHLSDIDFIISHISEALENSRKITYDLCPPVLYQLGIVDTMHWFSDKIKESYKIDVRFTTNKESIELNDKELIFIYRCIQELVTNSIKHAHASLISIDFKLIDKGLHIKVSDNGIGFNVNTTQNNKILNSGFGLFTLKERVHNLNGTVNIISKPDYKAGTSVDIFISL